MHKSKDHYLVQTEYKRQQRPLKLHFCSNLRGGGYCRGKGIPVIWAQHQSRKAGRAFNVFIADENVKRKDICKNLLRNCDVQLSVTASNNVRTDAQRWKKHRKWWNKSANSCGKCRAIAFWCRVTGINNGNIIIDQHIIDIHNIYFHQRKCHWLKTLVCEMVQR